jgi:2,3-bisphosphoglycerate-independent phosphoglycerate mutase
MDRDKRWDRVQRAYDAIVCGQAPYEADAAEAVQKSYDAGVTDEFMEPVVCVKDVQVRDNDSVIFFNFRPDRAREITRCLVDEDFSDVERKTGFVPVCFVCTTEYDATMPNVSVAYPRQKLVNIFGEYISKLGLTQLRIAETEKYAHVTFFFNGGVEQVFPGEDRCLIASPKVPTYDMQPEMSAYEVTEEAVKRILSGAYDVIILNFANCDMVGHTGIYDAACKAVTTVDECVGKVVEATSKMGGVSLITADHGNAERMIDTDGSPFTAHTTNLVPFCIVGASVALRDGRLADIAPTMLDLMGLEKPAEMDGQTLICS